MFWIYCFFVLVFFCVCNAALRCQRNLCTESILWIYCRLFLCGFVVAQYAIWICTTQCTLGCIVQHTKNTYFAWPCPFVLLSCCPAVAKWHKHCPLSVSLSLSRCVLFGWVWVRKWLLNGLTWFARMRIVMFSCCCSVRFSARVCVFVCECVGAC